jgi:hypothetical protein
MKGMPGTRKECQEHERNDRNKKEMTGTITE